MRNNKYEYEFVDTIIKLLDTCETEYDIGVMGETIKKITDNTVELEVSFRKLRSITESANIKREDFQQTINGFQKT